MSTESLIVDRVLELRVSPVSLSLVVVARLLRDGLDVTPDLDLTIEEGHASWLVNLLAKTLVDG